MVGLNIFDENKIDTSSSDTRKKVAESIKEYVLRNWDSCVLENQYQDSKNFWNAEFRISL